LRCMRDNTLIFRRGISPYLDDAGYVRTRGKTIRANAANRVCIPAEWFAAATSSRGLEALGDSTTRF